MSRMRKVLIGAAVAVAVLLLAATIVYRGGQAEGPGQVHPAPLSPALVGLRLERQKPLLPSGDSQILFGDLHVHSTFSADAFMMSLPLLAGEGAHPPADACDYARYCSQLDFFSITDHAEALTPRRWRDTKETMRQCEAVAGEGAGRDLVPFVGFEWSQVGLTPEEHWGHRNVIFRQLGEDQVPTRPIAAPGFVERAMRNTRASVGLLTLLSVPILDFAQRQRYLDLFVFQRETTSVPGCQPGADVHALPDDCREVAIDPKQLFEKLGQWGYDALVIPHGTTWGFYTPPGYAFDKGLRREQHDPDKQRLLEISSGHGNSEEYKSWRATVFDADGKPSCPEPVPGFEPCCWRAGEIIRSRCGDAPADECARRVSEARQRYVEASAAGHLTVPGATVEDWKDCGQCRDCFNPAFMYRPGGAAQYILAKGDFGDPAAPHHPMFGFISSSDNHASRPGTGYKEVERRKLTEATGPVSEAWRDRIFGKPAPPLPESEPLPAGGQANLAPIRAVHIERQASFFLTGGLVAVHAGGRTREAIWDALGRREVYGTSGDRILLWFDMQNGPDGTVPMGGEVRLGETPRFVVRAAGSFEQKPGCPDFSGGGLPADEVARLCLGECYNPGDRRRRITRVEVVRIRPQIRADEPVEALIEDAWKRLPCPEGPVCTVEIDDPDFVRGGRDVVYYVRAIQEPTPAANAGGVRCERDQSGACIKARPCYGDWRTPFDDDCLTENEERAWSSPIYVRFDQAAVDAAKARAEQDEERAAEQTEEGRDAGHD